MKRQSNIDQPSPSSNTLPVTLVRVFIGLLARLTISHGGMMLGGTLSFLGPSTLLSTIFRASSNACAGVGSGGVLVSRRPSSS